RAACAPSVQSAGRQASVGRVHARVAEAGAQRGWWSGRRWSWHWLLSSSGGLGEAIAGEAQVDVVEARPARRDRRHGELEHLELGERRSDAATLERHRQRRADGERVPSGEPVLAEAQQRLFAVAVDAKLDQ